jgi:hypothetical protein
MILLWILFIILFRVPYGAGSGWVFSFEKHLASGSARIGINTSSTNCDTGTVPIPILSTYNCDYFLYSLPPPPVSASAHAGLECVENR